MSVESLLSKANGNKNERREASDLFYLKPPHSGMPKANPSLKDLIHNKNKLFFTTPMLPASVSIKLDCSQNIFEPLGKIRSTLAYEIWLIKH
jgi:hypothetical protein